jgi:hypothetical protein
MLHAAEVGLCGISQQVVRRRVRLGQVRGEKRRIDAQVAAAHRDVVHGRAPAAGILADAVDGVVVVEGEGVASARLEWIGFAHQFQCAAGIRREDGGVLRRVGVEERQHRGARLFH